MGKDTSFTIRDLPRAERPRERLQKFGPEALSSQELLALILGRGIKGESVMVTAQRLLSGFGSIKGISNASLEELSDIRGIGIAKAAQIRACFELSKRQDLEPELRDIEIKEPQSIVPMLRSRLKEKAKEHFMLVLLNSRNKMTGISTVSIGTLDSNLVHPREVFREAISRNAASVIFAHNHPSGDSEPSEDDLTITKRLVEAGRILGIEVTDHIIITKNGFFSFKEKGLL